MSLKGGDRMNTYITRWLFACTIMVSTVFSYTLEELRDPTFQPFEDKIINKWERARMIQELEAQMNLSSEENEKEDVQNRVPAVPVNNDERIRIKFENAEKSKALFDAENSEPIHISPEPQFELQEDTSVNEDTDMPVDSQINYDYMIDVREKEAFNRAYQQKLDSEARAEKNKRMKELRDQRESLKKVLTREEQAAEYYSNNSIIDMGINNALENAGSSRCDDNALTLSVTDSYGDTWNGGTLGINGVLYSNDVSPYSANTQTIDLCLPDGDYAWTYTAGSYAYENSWSLVDANGIVLISGSGSGLSSGETLTGSFSVSSSAVAGCTVASACNFDPAATLNDGSCILPNDCGSCPDADGLTDTSCYGCTDSTALNYDASATVDDGSCYNQGDVCAAAEPLTLPLTYSGDTANHGDFYSSTPCFSNGYVGGHDWVGTFTLAEQSFLSGSVSSSGYNYPSVSITSACLDAADVSCVGGAAGSQGGSFSNALLEAGTYFVTVSNYPTPYTTAFDLSLSAVATVYGCADSDASNYLPSVNLPCTDDDGDNFPDCCIYLQAQGCTNPDAVNYDEQAELDDGSCVLPGDTCAAPVLLELPLDLTSTTNGRANTYTSTPCTSSSGVISGVDWVGSFTLAEKSFLSGSFTDQGSAYGSVSITDQCIDNENADCAAFIYTGFSGSGSFSDEVLEPGTYFVTVSNWPAPSFIDFNLQLSAVAIVSGCGDPLADDYDANVNDPCADADGDGYADCCSYTAVVGCTDSSACNYDASATADDGSCELPNDCGACPDYANGQYDDGEPFVDILYGNGVYDLGEDFVDNLVFNGTYDDGESFTDIGNGVWDEGEAFVDSCSDTNYDENGNELTDGTDGCADYISAWCGEYDSDTFDSGTMCCICGGGDANGTYDLGESFTDIGNGVWDEGEAFVDQGVGNGVYDDGEEFTDILYGNGVWDEGETYTDVTTPADDSCYGCLDETACNYDPDATVASDDYPCVFAGSQAQSAPCSCPTTDGVSTGGTSNYSFGNYTELCANPDGWGAEFSISMTSGAYQFISGSIYDPADGGSCSAAGSSSATAFNANGGWSGYVGSSITATLEAGECINYRIYDLYGYITGFFGYGQPSAQGVLTENPDPSSTGGCLDAAALNYDATVDYDDGSCRYAYEQCATAEDTSSASANLGAGDTHYYAFTVPAGSISTTVSLCGSPIDTKLEILGACADATYLLYNDDGCSGFGSGSSYASSITSTLEGGDYIAKVYGYSSSTSGAYSLNISSVEPVVGCTDGAALNFDETANTPCDDCCEYPVECTNYTVWMGDQYGDTWEGAILSIGSAQFTGPPSGCELYCTSDTDCIDLGNGVYDYAEQFVDANENGVYDDGEEYTDANANGQYDAAEPFTDLGNGVYDLGEPFTDDGNGVYDAGEAFSDTNANGQYDIGEPYTDLGNGVYDDGESFTDIGNGVYDDGESWDDGDGDYTNDTCHVEETVCLADGLLNVSMTSGTCCDDEHEWKILDESGAVVVESVNGTVFDFTCSADEGPNCSNAGQQNDLCFDNSETESCLLGGCMLADAPNYNPNAEVDNGSCDQYAGANYGYWDSDGLVGSIPADQYYLDCNTYYIYADCRDDNGAVNCLVVDDNGTPDDSSDDTVTDNGDGVPDAVGNGDCDNSGSLFCAEFNYDATAEGICDCADDGLVQTVDENANCYEAPVLGCTDENAQNTDENANVSCTEELAAETGCTPCDYGCGDAAHAFIINANDSFGDGWNGATMTIGESTFGLSSGSSASYEVCIPTGDYTVVVGGGSYDYEISWSIVDNDESSFWYGQVVLSGFATSGVSFSAPVPEYTCGDGVCNDASYTDVDGNAGVETCGPTDGDTSCLSDCGYCVWDQEAPTLTSTGTYFTADNGDVYPAIQYDWNEFGANDNSCLDIIDNPDLDACYTYSLIGNTCDVLESVGYDCTLVRACELCYVPTACEVAGGNDNYIGDGGCDYANNNAACDYDGGDCCPGGGCENSLWYPCLCIDPDSLPEAGSWASDCAASGGTYCGDDTSNWTVYSPVGCVSSAGACDGYDDCQDGSDEAYVSEGGSCADPVACSDTDNGATDSYGDACAAYANYPSWCGNYDDDDFDSNSMCCACGGGSSGSGGTMSAGNMTGYDPRAEDLDLIRAVYGFTSYPKSGYDNYGSLWTDAAKRKLREASIRNNSYSQPILNAETGEFTPAESSSRLVSYELRYTGSNGISYSVTTDAKSFLLYVSTDLASYCAEIRAFNTNGDATGWSEQNCNQAGFSQYTDCTGSMITEAQYGWLNDSYCDDGTYGVDFACAEFNCDNGSCEDACGECLGAGPQTTCWDGSLACDLDSCPAEPVACVAGDLNGDDLVNVLDVVALVAVVLSQGYDECGDLNNDGLSNVLDVVAQVSIVLSAGNARVNDATSAVMTVQGNTLNVSGNGYIGAVQITLEHDSDISLELTNDAMVADYVSNENTTTLIVVAPESSEIFTATGDFEVVEAIVANSSTYVNVVEVGSFALKSAYPNPFNPTTSLGLDMPFSGYVSIKAYNLVGQVVGIISEGNLDAGMHTFTWDASSLSSGVYFITAEYAGNISTQKVMLMK